MQPLYNHNHGSVSVFSTKEFIQCDLLEDMDETIGSRLKRLRKAAHLTQAALAAHVGLGQSAIGNIEAGVRGYGASVVPIAQALHTSPEYLLLETATPPTANVHPTVLAGQSDLSPYALELAFLFEELPKDRITRTIVYQACTQSILKALQQHGVQPMHGLVKADPARIQPVERRVLP